jgi:energy-coupling factor transporter ATP-binding protein EcfA2
MTLEIEAAGLSLRYGAVTALDDLTFKLAGGRIYGLLGRNGSGKTSLLSVLAGFRKASGGRVLVDGQPVFENPRVTRRVCLIRETGDTATRTTGSATPSPPRPTCAPAGTATTRPPWSSASRSRPARSWVSSRSASGPPSG